MNDVFPPNSRYRNVALVTRTEADGSEVTFVGRRIIPALERFRALERRRPDAGSRVDDVAADAYGDPEQYWRICDANGDAEPATATQPDTRLLVIPIPLEIADDGNA